VNSLFSRGLKGVVYDEGVNIFASRNACQGRGPGRFVFAPTAQRERFRLAVLGQHFIGFDVRNVGVYLSFERLEPLERLPHEIRLDLLRGGSSSGPWSFAARQR